MALRKAYSIGFTQRSAKDFLETIRGSGISQLLDVRLNNVSQLAGFSKKDDLAYFLQEICHVSYKHEPLLAPNQEMLNAYRKDKGSWADYEKAFLKLMAERQVQRRLVPEMFQQPTVLL